MNRREERQLHASFYPQGWMSPGGLFIPPPQWTAPPMHHWTPPPMHHGFYTPLLAPVTRVSAPAVAAVSQRTALSVNAPAWVPEGRAATPSNQSNDSKCAEDGADSGKAETADSGKAEPAVTVDAPAAAVPAIEESEDLVKASSGDIQVVVQCCKRLEQTLRTQFGGKGNGLGEIVNSLTDRRITRDTKRRIRSISRLRNDMVHELDFNTFESSTYRSEARFTDAVEKVERELAEAAASDPPAEAKDYAPPSKQVLNLRDYLGLGGAESFEDEDESIDDGRSDQSPKKVEESFPVLAGSATRRSTGVEPDGRSARDVAAAKRQVVVINGRGVAAALVRKASAKDRSPLREAKSVPVRPSPEKTFAQVAFTGRDGLGGERAFGTATARRENSVEASSRTENSQVNQADAWKPAKRSRPQWSGVYGSSRGCGCRGWFPTESLWIRAKVPPFVFGLPPRAQRQPVTTDKSNKNIFGVRNRLMSGDSSDSEDEKQSWLPAPSRSVAVPLPVMQNSDFPALPPSSISREQREHEEMMFRVAMQESLREQRQREAEDGEGSFAFGNLQAALQSSLMEQHGSQGNRESEDGTLEEALRASMEEQRRQALDEENLSAILQASLRDEESRRWASPNLVDLSEDSKDEEEDHSAASEVNSQNGDALTSPGYYNHVRSATDGSEDSALSISRSPAPVEIVSEHHYMPRTDGLALEEDDVFTEVVEASRQEFTAEIAETETERLRTGIEASLEEVGTVPIDEDDERLRAVLEASLEERSVIPQTAEEEEASLRAVLEASLQEQQSASRLAELAAKIEDERLRAVLEASLLESCPRSTTVSPTMDADLEGALAASLQDQVAPDNHMLAAHHGSFTESHIPSHSDELKDDDELLRTAMEESIALAALHQRCPDIESLDAKVESLVAMGFERDQVLVALELHNGDLDSALEYLCQEVTCDTDVQRLDEDATQWRSSNW